jgi:hypothetical protein
MLQCAHCALPAHLVSQANECNCCNSTSTPTATPCIHSRWTPSKIAHSPPNWSLDPIPSRLYALCPVFGGACLLLKTTVLFGAYSRWTIDDGDLPIYYHSFLLLVRLASCLLACLLACSLACLPACVLRAVPCHGMLDSGYLIRK